MDGFDGTDGLAGLDGTPGSMDPANPQAGGNGSDGSRGSDGANGNDGWPGETVHLWVTLQPGPIPLIQVRAVGSSHEQYFLIDPNGGSLSIDANGGAGGRGGRGGKGGRGGSGGIGSPSGSSGNSGFDGQDGHPGSDGAPGKIIVTIDPSVQPYLNRLHFSNHGSGYAAPAPEIHTESVPALW